MRQRISRKQVLLAKSQKVDINEVANKQTAVDRMRDPKVKPGVWYTKVFGRTLVISEKEVDKYLDMGFDVFQNQ